MIGKQKCIRRVGLTLVIVTLLYSWDVLSLEYMTNKEKIMVDQASFDIDDDAEELIWLNCRSEIFGVKDTNEDLDLFFLHQGPDSTNNLNYKFQSEEKEKFLSLLHPELKKNLIDCLRRNGLPFHISSEQAGSNNKDNLMSSSSRHRRSLASGSSSKSSRSKSSKVDHEKIIIIAVAVTATATFLFAMLLFLCFYKLCGSSSDDDLNDDKPLLCLSSSDRSSGSSHKRFGSGDLVKDENLDDQQLNHNLSNKTKSSLLGGNGNSTNIISNDMKQVPSGRVPSALELKASGPLEGGSLLPPPPGRVLSSPKPSFGRNILASSSGSWRAEPLPPEPPFPPKPPPTKAPPPAPAPPTPLPNPTTASGGPKPPPAPPPGPSGRRPGPPPPPQPQQPKGGGGAPRPPAQPITGKLGKAPPNAPKTLGHQDDGGGSKTKLKPFFWDKAQANPDSSMVWHQLKAGSFQFNEEMIETLFGYNNVEKNKKEIKKESSQEPSTTIVQIIDAKKSQNLSILLKALNVTIQEVCDALLEGNELPIEFLQTVLKMAPSSEEELKLRLFNGEISQLGIADRFLKSLVDIPFAFKRMEALVFMITLEDEVIFAKESFENLEVACKELKSSRLFLKLLEAVLKTGNRMNSGTYRGGAQAFKLDTLLKLSDVRGADGKTTLLHFVVQEIIRSEGIRAVRAARESHSFSSVKSEDFLEEDVPEESEDYYRSLGLQVVSGLSVGLENVKKAAGIDADNLTGTVAKLGHSLMRTREFMNTDMKDSHEECGFHDTLKSFVKNAEMDVMLLLEEEKRIMGLVKRTGDYFHGNAQGKDEGLRLFVIVRDFLIMLDKACREVKDAPKKKQVVQQKKELGPPTLVPSSSDHSRLKEEFPAPAPKLAQSGSDSCLPVSQEMRQRFFPAIQERRGGGDSSSSSSSSSSDNES